MKKLVLRVGGILGIIFLMFSCKKGDPEVVLEKEGVLSVSIQSPSLDTPMSCYIYPTSGDNTLISTISDGQNFSKELPEGEYAVSVWGYDPTEAGLQGEDTYETTLLSVYASGDTIYSLNHPVGGISAQKVVVKRGETTSLSLTATDLRRTLSINVNIGSGFAGAKVSGTLSGIASTVRLTADQPVVSSGRLLAMTATPAAASGEYLLEGGVLGIIADEKKGNLLSLTIVTQQGETYIHEEDLTQPLADALAAGKDTLNVSIVARPAVPVKLYTGIRTRASVDMFDQTAVSIAVGTSSGQFTDSWEGVATAGEIRLQPERYYPTDGSPLFLRGYYPPAPLEGNEIHYTLTGQEDLMLSVEQSGSLSQRFDEVGSPLIYSHLLSQLNFTLNLKGASGDCKVRSVHLNGMASAAVVSLSSGSVAPVGPSAPVVVYTDSGTGGFPVVDGKVTLPGYVLVQPQATLTLDLVLAVDGDPSHDLTFTDLPINFEGGSSQGGNAYEVKIELKVPDVPDVPDDPDVPDTPDEPDNPDNPDEPDQPDPPTPPTPPTPPDDPNEKDQIKVKAEIIPWKSGNGGGAIL